MRNAMKSLLSRSIAFVLTLGVAGDAHAADWKMKFSKVGPTSADLSWDAEPGQQFLVCWKLDSLGGDVCGAYSHSGDASAVPGWPGYANGRVTMRLFGLDKCGVDYKIRVRRTFFAFDTAVFRFPC